MNGRSQAEIGAGCIAVFVVSSAFRDVYLGDVFQSISVFIVLLVAFGIATVAGLAVARARGETLAFIAAARGDVVAMNLGTAGAWICYFLALKWLDPSIVSTLFAGIGPFAVIALGACGLPIAAPPPTTRAERLLQFGTVGSLLALVFIVATGRSGFQSVVPLYALASAGLALLAGVLIVVGHLYAKRLNDSGVSASAILGTRFFGLLAMASAGVVHDGGAALTIPLPALAQVAGAATLLIVMPVFFNQVGMSLISPLAARVITAAGPAFVFGLQQADPRIAWSPGTGAAVFAYSAFVIAANLVHGKLWKTSRTSGGPRVSTDSARH